MSVRARRERLAMKLRATLKRRMFSVATDALSFGEKPRGRTVFRLRPKHRSPEIRARTAAVIGLLYASATHRQCWFQMHWRRECDWAPTCSEFLATILLGRVRLGSNCRHDISQESGGVVREVQLLKGVDRESTVFASPPQADIKLLSQHIR